MNININSNKDTLFLTQLEIVDNYLKEYTASRFMVAIDTGIPIQNVCRYVAMLFDRNQIAIVRKDKCFITGEIVEYLTTNPDLFPKDKQLKLWD